MLKCPRDVLSLCAHWVCQNGCVLYAPRFSVKTKGINWSPSAWCQGHDMLPQSQRGWACLSPALLCDTAQLQSEVPRAHPGWRAGADKVEAALRPWAAGAAVPEQHLREGRGRTQHQGGTRLLSLLQARPLYGTRLVGTASTPSTGGVKTVIKWLHCCDKAAGTNLNKLISIACCSGWHSSEGTRMTDFFMCFEKFGGWEQKHKVVLGLLN